VNAYVVGADRLGNIPETLSGYGVSILDHVSGRESAHQRKSSLPRRADLLILFTDFLGHNVMRNFRDAARDAGVPVIACRRSRTCLKDAMDQCLRGRDCSTCEQRGMPAQGDPRYVQT
jgi:hypothetical protein